MSSRQQRGGLWVLGQFVIIFGYAISLRLVEPLRALSEQALLGTIGLGLSAAALLWCLWSVFTLRRSLSAYPTPTRTNALVTKGPYAMVRHPIYSGLCVGLIGWALFRAALAGLVVVVLLVFYLAAKAGIEERALQDRHPEYVEYMKRTKWKIFPGL